jgi:ABC-type Fe3+ transport system permease subunit
LYQPPTRGIRRSARYQRRRIVIATILLLLGKLVAAVLFGQVVGWVITRRPRPYRTAHRPKH